MKPPRKIVQPVRHILLCLFWRTLLCSLKRIGLICIPEGQELRLTWAAVFRRQKDGGAILGRPFCRARWKLAAAVWRERWELDKTLCEHTDPTFHAFRKHSMSAVWPSRSRNE